MDEMVVDENILFYLFMGGFLLILSIINTIQYEDFSWIIMLFLSVLSFLYGISVYRINWKIKKEMKNENT